MIEILSVAGIWVGIMALIGIALLLTKRIADFIGKNRSKTPKTPDQISPLRNPYYISPEEAAAIKEQTEKANKKEQNSN